MGPVRLGLVFLAWGVLGTAVFFGLILVYHRAVSLGRQVRKA